MKSLQPFVLANTYLPRHFLQSSPPSFTSHFPPSLITSQHLEHCILATLAEKVCLLVISVYTSYSLTWRCGHLFCRHSIELRISQLLLLKSYLLNSSNTKSGCVNVLPVTMNCLAAIYSFILQTTQ